MEDGLLTVSEAAKFLRVRRETIRRYIRKGYLKAVSLPGGDYRLQMSHIQKLLSRIEDDTGSKDERS